MSDNERNTKPKKEYMVFTRDPVSKTIFKKCAWHHNIEYTMKNNNHYSARVHIYCTERQWKSFYPKIAGLLKEQVLVEIPKGFQKRSIESSRKNAKWQRLFGNRSKHTEHRRGVKRKSIPHPNWKKCFVPFNQRFTRTNSNYQLPIY